MNMKNIVIVVDMQKAFARYEQTIELQKRIQTLLSKNVFDVVIGTRFNNNVNSIYEKLFNWKKLQTSEDREIPYEIKKHMDYIEDKNIYNCVNASFIQRLCQLNDGKYPDRVFLIGADTDCCVLTIATSLFENNIRPIVLTSYCNSNGGPEAHNAGVRCMKRLVGGSQLVDREIDNRNDLSDL